MAAKPSIKTITIKRLFWMGLLFLVVVLVMIAKNFQTLIAEAMQDKATTLAMSVESALTSHMLASNFRQKERLVAQAAKIPGVNNLRIIRHPILNAQFDLPDTVAEQQDAVVREVFASGQPRYLLPELGDTPPNLRVAYPYLVRDDPQVQCTSCHQAKAGEVLAVLQFEVDMGSYLHISLTTLYALFATFVLAMMVLGLFLYRVFDRNVKLPLEQLIEETHTSYAQHIEIDTDRYESMELEYVAEKVNQFNQLILQKNDELLAMNREIEATQKEIIHALGYIGEARSKETAQHVRRVSELSYLLARKLGLPEEECEKLKLAAPMHDIGKVGIPDSILLKPDRLTDDEFDIMKQHSESGHNVFKHSKRPLLRAASIISHQHHERWDGKGYPQGLREDGIHIYGRIVAVADVFDALASKRCYKEPWEPQAVHDYFESQAGQQFDPKIVQALLELFDEAMQVMERYRDSLGLTDTITPSATQVSG